MDNLLEITKNTLNEKYKEIYELTEPINITKTNNMNEYSNDIKYIQKSENMLTTVYAYIYNIDEYGEFYLEVILEGNKFINKNKIKNN